MRTTRNMIYETAHIRVKKEPTIMIIPMIDIVFFLLVFFMVGTLYMNTEQQIPLNCHLHRHLQQNLLNLLRLRSPQRTRYISTIRKSLPTAWPKRYNLSWNKHLDKLLSFAHLRMFTIARLSPYWTCSRWMALNILASLRNGSDSMFESHYLKPFVVSLGITTMLISGMGSFFAGNGRYRCRPWCGGN